MAGIATPESLYGLPTPDRQFGLPDPLKNNPVLQAESDVRSKGQELRQASRTTPLDIGSPSSPAAPVTEAAGPSVSDDDFFKPIVVGGSPAQATSQTSPAAQNALEPTAIPAEDDFFKPIVVAATPDNPTPTTTPQEEEGWVEGIGKALVQGTQQTGSSLVAAGGAYANSESTVVGASNFSAELEKNSELQALKRLQSDIERDKQEYEGKGGLTELWGSVKNVVGNMVANPKGGAEFIASQLPNSGVALGSGLAGAAAGTAVLPGWGTAIGFVSGMFFANTALETGGKAQEKARDGNFTSDERTEAIEEGTVKGGVITAVDAATLGVSRALAGIPGRSVEAATARVLERNGINATKASDDIAQATKAAMDSAKGLEPQAAQKLVEEAVAKSLARNGMTNPTVVKQIQEAQQAAYSLSNRLVSKGSRVAGGVALETVGEGVGEYLGEYAATGKADMTDAVMEAFAGLGTSIGELRMLAKQAEVNPGTLTKATASQETKPSGTTGSQSDPANGSSTALGTDLGLLSTAFERSIAITEGENLLGAMWATGDKATQQTVQRVLERSGKLDLIDTLNLSGSVETAQANVRVQAGMQMMSDMPAFARDFAITAERYANTQPNQRAKPKWDKRQNAPVVEGVDPLNNDPLTPEQLDAINAEAQQAAENMSERSQGAVNQPNDLTPEEIDQINAEAALAGSAARRSEPEVGRTISEIDNANFEAQQASRSGRVNRRLDNSGSPLSVQDEVASQNIEKVIDAGGDGRAVLRQIIADQNTTEFHREIASKLLEMDVNPSIVFASNINDGNAIGGYDPAPNRISIDRYNGGALTPLVLHEYIHAMTRSSSWLQTKIGKEMNALYKKYEKFKGPNSEYGFESADEFFSELLSNPDFQRLVKSLKVDGIVGQLWNRFVEIIAKMLGIKRKDIVAKALDITNRASKEKAGLQGDVERADRMYQMREQGQVAMRGNERGQDPIATRQTDAELVSDITVKERAAKALDSRIGVSGLAMDLPRTLIDATVAKAPKNADSMAALQAFADSLEPLIKARKEYDALTRGQEVQEIKDAAAAMRVAEREGVDLEQAQARLNEATQKRPELLAKYRVLKANLDAATSAYESAMKKLDGGKEVELPEKYFDRDLEKATAERTPKYENSKQAKANAPADMGKAKAKREELRKQFIDQLLAGDMGSAFASWEEYYGPNMQTVDQDGKVKRGSKSKFEQKRFNEMISAIRWVYNNLKDANGNKNAGLKALLDRTWAQKEAFDANRKSFLWNMVHNQMFRDIMDEAVKDMRQGVIQLSNDINEIRKSPRVRALLSEGLTEKQKDLVGKLIKQTTLQDLTAYYETKFWDSRKQGELEITTKESEAIADFQKELDFALNGMYRTALSNEAGVIETIDDETGEVTQRGAYDDVLAKLRDRHAELVAMAGEFSRGASDEAGYLIALMTPQREGFAVDSATMSDFVKGQEALETRYSFDPDNVDRSAIQQMADELGREIREMEVNRVRNRARVFQYKGHDIFTALSIARRNAAQKGLPTQVIDQMYFDAVRTLHVGMGVKLNRNALLLAIPNDKEAVDKLLNALPDETNQAQESVAESTQNSLFTEQDLEETDRVAALTSFIEDVKAGRLSADEATAELIKAMRNGEMSALEIRKEFSKRGIAVPIETINTLNKLPYRTSLRDYLARHGGDRLYYHEWMSELQKLDVGKALVDKVITKRELYEYRKWRDNKRKMEQRIVAMGKRADAESAIWVFSDLLFANYSLAQMRDLNLIENTDDRNNIRALFLDPVNQWHKDLEHARISRPDLINQVLMPSGGVTDLVSSADIQEHLVWKSIRDSIGERDVRISGDIKHVQELIDEALKEKVIDQDQLDDRYIEEVRYYLPEDMRNEVDPEEAGAVPVKRRILVPGLRSILYRTMPNERHAAMRSWLAMNYGATAVQREEMLADFEQEDALKSSTAAEFEQRVVEEYWSEEAQGEEARQEMNDEASYEQYLQDMQEAGAWDQDDIANSYDSDNRLRQGAYSGVISVAALQDWVISKTETWTSAPNIRVLASHHHLPEPLLSQVKGKLAKDYGAKGLYDGGTHTVYMFADYINGEADAEFTLFHEVFGHYGMRALLGKEFDSFLTTQYNTNGKLRALAEMKMSEGMPMLEAMDEVLSDMSAAIEAPSAYNMYVGRVLAGLRKIGLGKVADWFAFLTHAELSYTLEASKRAVKSGVLNAGGAPDVLRMAAQRNPYEMFAVTKDGKTKAYARYNPIIDEWYVFKSQGADIRDGNYTVYSSQDYDAVLRDLQSLGKVESRMRSARFIDNKIPADFIKLPKFSELSKWKKRARLARIGIQNEYASVWNLVEYLVAEGRMSKNFDLKTALTLYERRTAASVERYNKEFVEPVMEALDRLKKAGKLTMPSFLVNGEQIQTVNDLVNTFLVAQTAEERNKQILKVGGKPNGSGMSDADAKRILSFVQSQSYYADLLEIGNKLDDLSQWKIDLEVKAGLISADDAAKRMGAYKHYRNLSGVKAELDEDVSTDPSLNIGRKFNLRGSDKRAMGRSDIAPDVLARTLLGGEASVIRAHKNEIAQKVLMLFETNYDPNYVVINEIKSARQINRATGLIEVNDDPNYIKRPDVMIAKVNGIPTAIRFKEQGNGSVAEALHGAVVPRESHPFFEAMGQYNRFFGQLLTTYNPAWIAVNFVRDYQTLISNAVADGRLPKGAGRKMAKAVFPAMRASIHIALTEFKPKTLPGKLAIAGIRTFFKLMGKPDARWLASYNEAKMAGGLTSFIDRKGLEEQMIEIDRALNGAHGVDAAMQKVKGLLSFVELMSIPTELAPRLAAYHVMRTQGFTQEQSAVFSGEITVNFNMRGATKELRQLYLFFNPAVQGTAKMVKVLKQSPGRFATIAMAWVGFGAMMNLVARSLGGEDDDGIDKLDKIPPLKRATAAVYHPDQLFGAIPIAYGYNAFYAVGQFMMDAVLQKNTVETSLKRVASTTFEAFSPIGNGAFEHKSPITTGAKLTLPTVTHPMIEWIANENRFGSPIYKSQNAMTGVKDPDTYMNFNSANPISVFTMRTIHEMTGGNRFNRDGIDLNPAAVDHFVNSFAPGVIAETYKAAGATVNKMRGRDTKNEKLPLIGRFQADVPDQWYDGAYRKVKEVVAEREREILRTHKSDAKSALAKKYPNTIEAAAIISGVDKIVRDRAVLLEKARNNEDYSPQDIVSMENTFEKDNRVMYEMAVKSFLNMGYRQTILGDN
jgi:hypothetical protein